MDFCPLPDCSLYQHSLANGQRPFVIVSMFTPSLRHQADRLAASIRQFDLNFALFEVPTVHRSISAKGTDQIAFSKANFINWTLLNFGCPVLYLDIDVVLCQHPTALASLQRDNIDFACYNWLADAATDGYMPFPVKTNADTIHDRFYKFTHAVDAYDVSQLMCSGPVQYYSFNALPLLLSWINVVDRLPSVPDDQSLDCAYNFIVNKKLFRAAWLGKEYCRYPWWIHVQPIIKHPDVPAPPDPAVDFTNTTKMQRLNLAATKTLPAQGPFPRDCLIDTQEGVLLRPGEQGELMPFGRFTTPLWLD